MIGIEKRSIMQDKGDLPYVESLPIYSDLDPIPFDWLEHGHHFRRHKRSASCGDDKVQHVLFVLDTSGSIGPEQFTRVKNALARLIPLFCKQVKIAVVSFSHHIHLEFCFDCYKNTLAERNKAKKAIEDIRYRGGGTHTGSTAKCVCDKILKSSCGFDSMPTCLDVVFITDGKSNDPTLKICEEIRCLHNRVGVDTYAIGINSGFGFTQSFNRAELECITNSTDLSSAFEFDSFDDFEASINKTIKMVIGEVVNGHSLACAKVTGTVSPTGLPTA